MFREEEQYNNMKITEIEVGEIFVPLAKPFKTALRTVENVEDIVVRITTDTGAAGYGEAPPTAVITGPPCLAWRSKIWTALCTGCIPAL